MHSIGSIVFALSLARIVQCLTFTSPVSFQYGFSVGSEIRSEIYSGETDSNAHIGSKTFSGTDIPVAGANIVGSSGLKYVKNAYIVKLKPDTNLTRRSKLSSHDIFHKRAGELLDYTIRHEFKSEDTFYGVSIQLKSDVNPEVLRELPNVLEVYPIQVVDKPVPVVANKSQGGKVGVDTSTNTTTFYKAVPGPGANVNAVHSMTEVDKLHAQGIRGKGIKIGIIDTGVDYEHPALGGCFGPGCKFEFGYAFVDDAYDGTGPEISSPNPITRCSAGGHGTHVSGIIGMSGPHNTPFKGLGVAPEATLGMYRVFGCNSGAPLDVIILAMQRAAEVDKVDIVSMSLGIGTASEALDPLADVTNALAAKGIAVIAASGNDGASGILTVSSPSVAQGAIAIGSIQSNVLPLVFTGNDSTGASFDYAGTSWSVNAPKSGLSVIHAGSEDDDTSLYGCDASNYALAASKVSNFSNVMVAVRRGNCRVTDKEQFAYDAGFQYLMIYNLPDADPVSSEYIFTEANPSLQLVSVTAETGTKMLSGIKASGLDYKLFFTSPIYKTIPAPLMGGLVSNFSSIGPTIELSMKPQFSAPGGNIFSTWPLQGGGYNVISGTSMAVPYASGCYALLMSAVPGLTLQEYRELLQSTATPVNYLYDKSITHAAIAQGSGLLNPFAAIYSSARTRVSPTELNLRDVGHLTEQNITIKNTGRNDHTYTISHKPAGLEQLIPYLHDPRAGPFGTYMALGLPDRPEYASVTFSESQVTIKPGQSATVLATFTPPKSDPDAIPVYSGFIQISNQNDVFTVPYAGLPYSYQDDVYIDTSSDIVGITLPSIVDVTNTPVLENHTYNFADDFPITAYYLKQITFYTRVDVVPYNTTVVPTHYGFDPEAPLPTDLLYPPFGPNMTVAEVDIYGGLNVFDGLFGPTFIGAYWQGYIYTTPNADGTYKRYLAPEGDYRILLRTLKTGGNNETEADYESWLSHLVRIRDPQMPS